MRRDRRVALGLIAVPAIALAIATGACSIIVGLDASFVQADASVAAFDGPGSSNDGATGMGRDGASLADASKDASAPCVSVPGAWQLDCTFGDHGIVVLPFGVGALPPVMTALNGTLRVAGSFEDDEAGATRERRAYILTVSSDGVLSAPLMSTSAPPINLSEVTSHGTTVEVTLADFNEKLQELFEFPAYSTVYATTAGFTLPSRTLAIDGGSFIGGQLVGDVGTQLIVVGSALFGSLTTKPVPVVAFAPDEQATSGDTSFVFLDAAGPEVGDADLVGTTGLVESPSLGWMVVGTFQREGSVVLNVVDGGSITGRMYSPFNLDDMLRTPLQEQAIAGGASDTAIGELLLNADGSVASVATVSAPDINAPYSSLVRDDGGSVFVGLDLNGRLSLARFLLSDGGLAVDSTFGDGGLVQIALDQRTTFGAAAALGDDYCVSYVVATTPLTGAIACVRHVPFSDGGTGVSVDAGTDSGDNADASDADLADSD